jgi:3D (Asp-Asp-Asp) domain-containing protein
MFHPKISQPCTRLLPRISGGSLLLAVFGLLALLLGGCAPMEQDHPAKGAHVSRMTVRTTAYTHTEAGGASSAVGTRLRFGSDVSSASADWSWLPVGTRFRLVETGRVYVIEDYGSALVGNKTIDLYMPNAPMMRAWGVRTVNIEILEWGSLPMSRMLLQGRRGGETARRMLASMP